MYKRIFTIKQTINKLSNHIVLKHKSHQKTSRHNDLDKRLNVGLQISFT